MSQFYDFSATSLQGQEIDMNAYKDKVVLIVNTASKCGFTPQYAGLQELYQRYADKGLVILGFPCNQFGNQEPGDASTIKGECLINYGVDFPMFAKTDVNGTEAHPLFNYLKEALPGMLGKSVKWNFTKFLIGKDGQPVKRFAPLTKPQNIEPYIQAELSR